MRNLKKKMNVLLLTVLCCQLFLSGCGSNKEMLLMEEAALEQITQEEPVTEDCLKEDAVRSFGEKLYVYICGAINDPGVYEVPLETRVYEIIKLAGGCTPEAATEAVNQARLLIDGEQIKIPTREEIEQGEGTFEQIQESISEKSSSGKINLNTASMEELVTLKGIGVSRAQAIIQYREEHGAFQNIEEIMNISGIGKSTYEKLKEQISVR